MGKSNNKSWLWAIPAVVGFLLVSGLALFFTIRKEYRGQNSLSDAEAALRTGKFADAELLYRGLLRSNPNDLEFLWGYFLTSKALGRGDADLLLERLAPVGTEGGYPDAHMYRAKALLAGSRDSKNLQLAVAHLRSYSKLRPDRPEADFLLSQVYENIGEYAQAETVLTAAARKNPMFKLELARFYRRRGKENQGQALAAEFASLCERMLKQEKANETAKVGLYAVMVYKKQFSETVKSLQKEMQASSNPGLYRTLLAQAYFEWARETSANNKRDEASVYLHQALALAPNDALILREIASNLQDSPMSEALRFTLRDVVAHAKATAPIYFVLASDAWARGKVDEAKLNWEKVLELNPNMVTAANNLAYLLVRNGQANDRALALANLALFHAPGNYTFLHTRGQIYAKQKKWKEALADLREALVGYPTHPEIHADLAEVYTHLNATEMASQHAILAKKYSPATRLPAGN